MSSWTTRQTTGDDRTLIDGLLAGARWKHLHLDWLDPAALTDRQPFLLATQNGLPAACLGCPPDLPSVAWVRAFAVVSEYSAAAAWAELWEAAARALVELGVQDVAVMALDAWFGVILREAGFSQSNAVIFFEHELGGGAQPHANDIDLRAITVADIDAVLELDAAAFEPFWRLSEESAQAAIRQAMSASLFERNGSLVGYQITTGSPFGAHLARLAVHPQSQRQGVGRALVNEAIRAAESIGVGRLSVNTQADNTPSQALYYKLGFKETGQRFPVYFLAL
jgi:ribosomal-protein-alanine N-acetyltransferase